MNRPIDTLYYNWVIEENAKQIPTVFTEITEMDDEEKVSDLLETYAALVANAIESQVRLGAVIDARVEQAKEDPELDEMEQEAVAEAIMMLEDVAEINEEAEAASNALNVFHTALLKTLVSGE
jgi:hypothetical protein